jgi:hypothetical protein
MNRWWKQRHGRNAARVLKTTAGCGAPRRALHAAADYADAMFNLARLLQRNNKHAEAAEYWRRYLANEAKSEWAARARRCLKFCEMQVRGGSLMGR